MANTTIDYHEKYDAIMSFIDRYEEDIENAPDDSILAAFRELSGIEATTDFEHLVNAMYIIANIYNEERFKEENENG